MTSLFPSVLGSALAAALGGTVALAAPAALAAGGDIKHADHEFSFDGLFGAYDQGELQRGYQIYEANCSGCHGMRYVSFRTLGDETGPGFGEAEVKAIAAYYEVPDEEGEPGDMREGKPFDHFPTPAGVQGNPPDMSLLAKARADGAVHIYSILTGYTGEEKQVGDAILYGNTAYPGGWISMAPPLYDEAVEYADGTPATLEQHANDVSAFLMWAAEPKMVERKQAGLKYISFLILFAALVWYTNRKVWAKVKHPEDHA